MKRKKKIGIVLLTLVGVILITGTTFYFKTRVTNNSGSIELSDSNEWNSIKNETQMKSELSEEGKKPYYNSVISFEHNDSNRTHIFSSATFNGSIKGYGDNTIYYRKAPNKYIAPYNVVTGNRDELYIYGGGYGNNPEAKGSYVARLNSNTLEEEWRTQLIDLSDSTQFNYPGVIGILENGDIYAIYGNYISKLDSETGKIIKTKVLPVQEGFENDTAYNGFVVASDGTIIAKSISREKGSTIQGSDIFIKTNVDNLPNSIIAAIDPNTLEIIDSIEAKDFLGGRITLDRMNNETYIYVTGKEDLYRYTLKDGSIAIDSSWGPVRYKKGDQTSAPAVSIMNGYAIFQTNGLPSKTPLSLYAVSTTDDSNILEVQPFAEFGAKKSFLPSMQSVDPENNLIYTMDSFAGKLAEYTVKNEKLQRVWIRDAKSMDFTTLIGNSNNRVLLSTEVPFGTLGLKISKKQYVNFIDAKTGKLLAKSAALPRMSTGTLVTPGFDGSVYYMGYDGDFVELMVAKK